MRTIPFGNMRSNLAFRHFRGEIADCALIVAEFELRYASTTSGAVETFLPFAY